MVYFITRGKSPIYDKYAHLALFAIENGCNLPFPNVIDDSVLNNEFPNSSKPKTIFKAFEENYVGRIDRLFHLERYQEDRDIDRVLWAYGHMFSDTKANRKRCEPRP